MSRRLNAAVFLKHMAQGEHAVNISVTAIDNSSCPFTPCGGWPGFTLQVKREGSNSEIKFPTEIHPYPPTPRRKGSVRAMDLSASPPSRPRHGAGKVSLSVGPSGDHSQGLSFCASSSPSPSRVPLSAPHTPQRRTGRYLQKEQKLQGQQNLCFGEPCRNLIPFLHPSLIK